MRSNGTSVMAALMAVAAMPVTAAGAPETGAAWRTAFDLQLSRANVAQVANGAEVTPAIKPADLKGTLVMRGTGAPVYKEGGPGVAFTVSGQQNRNTSYYNFTGAGVGEMFDYRVPGQVEVAVESRLSFAGRKALPAAEGNRYVYRIALHVSDDEGSKIAWLGWGMMDDYITFYASFFNSGHTYFVPRGSEDAMFGKGVTIRIRVAWDGAGQGTVFVNGGEVGKFSYPMVNPKWTAKSNISIGASNSSDYGGGFWACDDYLTSITVEGEGPFVDTTPPEVSFLEPRRTDAQRGVIRLAAKATDNVSNPQVRFFVDGAPLGGVLTANPFQRLWDSRTVGDGRHTISVTATDQAGNSASSAVELDIVNGVPAATNSSPGTPGGLSVLHTAAGMARIGWESSPDDDGVARYDIYRDGKRIGSVPQGPVEAMQTFTDNSAGTQQGYSYKLQAVDGAGNRSASTPPLWVRTGTGKTLRVGPGHQYAKPCAAIAAAAPGDTIEVDAAGNGTYDGDVCGWTKADLTIRGVNGMARIDAAGKNHGGKAIWVIGGANALIENIELSGCKVSSGNGAGIRAEAPGLFLRRVYFHHNENGILGMAELRGTLTIEYSEFAYNGTNGSTHNMYIPSVDTFILRYSYSHHCRRGHLVKTRARVNHILYNRLTDEGGTASYELQIANGGTAYVIGNDIQQGARSENSNILAFGHEGMHTGAPPKLYFLNNTVVNSLKHDGCALLIDNKVTEPPLVQNNVFQTTNWVFCDSNQAKAIGINNHIGGGATYYAPEMHDYRIESINGGQMRGPDYSGLGLTLNSPQYVYAHPASASELKEVSDPLIGARWVTGQPGNAGSGPDDGGEPRQASDWIVNTASRQAVTLAPASLASAMGVKLASETLYAPGSNPPAELGGVTVSITDSAGATHAGLVSMVSPNQADFYIPGGVALGQASLQVKKQSGEIAAGSVYVTATGPGLFSADGSGSGAGLISVVHRDAAGMDQWSTAFREVAGAMAAAPISMSDASRKVYLQLYGTGMRPAGGAAGITASVGGVTVAVESAAAHGSLPGIDEIRVGPLPQSLAGSGLATVTVSAGGRDSNAVTVILQ
ncbi:MAG: hypothetical protein C0504_02210 [Candidatus Solibacter sp.]|nr:hypothetical protein [Candidatus Solibacter sp.]